MTQWGVDTLFNPAKRHMDEEKRRLQSTRQEVGDNSGGKRIDLESGKVRIGRRSAEEPDPSAEADDTEHTASEAVGSETVDSESVDRAETEVDQTQVDQTEVDQTEVDQTQDADAEDVDAAGDADDTEAGIS